MTTEKDIEIKVINRFILRDKRERYLTFIEKDKTRSKFTTDLSKINVFQEELFERISGNEVETLRNKLRGHKYIKDCYVISENKQIDARRMDIETALNSAVSPWSDTGTIIVFGDAEIVYREAEGPKNKWISR